MKGYQQVLRPGYTPPSLHCNIISSRGGLGDMIARLPAFRYMLEQHPHISLTIWTQDYSLELMQYLMPSTTRLEWKPYSKAPRSLKRPIIEFDDTRLTTLALHLTDHAFLILMDVMPPSQEARAYPKAEKVDLEQRPSVHRAALRALGSEMIVFTTDYTAPARAWPACHINTLAKKVREAGLTPVLLGKSQSMHTGEVFADGRPDDIKPAQADGLKPELFVDLRDRTTLIEALGVIQRARAVVGVDNGLLHLAHCTDTPVVMGFSTLKPEHRVPVRLKKYSENEYERDIWRSRTEKDLFGGAGLTKTLEALVPCAGCQSRGFGITHDEVGDPIDWRKCPMKESRYACLLTLTADRFFEKLKELGVVK